MKKATVIIIVICIIILLGIIGFLMYSLIKVNNRLAELESSRPSFNQTNEVNEIANTNTTNNIIENNTTSINTIENQTTNNKTQEEEDNRYSKLLNDYREALKNPNYDGSNELINDVLISHIKRYNDEKLKYSFYDIDGNGIKELIIGADGKPQAIYSYDTTQNKVVKIYYIASTERAIIQIYENGIIYVEGSGGAKTSYYEFGRIASNGIEYEEIEYIEREFNDEGNESTFKNYHTHEKLNYKSVDEMKNKNSLTGDTIRTNYYEL